MAATRRAVVLERILRLRASAIIRSDSQQLAADAMEAAVRGGFEMVEFTLTTPGAIDLISHFASRHADLLVGAGTVLTTEQADAAVRAGAAFVVSPVFDKAIVGRAHDLDVVSIPGTFTATEMITAHGHGADLVKLFPAPADVAQYVRAILGPLPDLRIFPTAGVDADNMQEVLRAGAAGVGFARSLFHPADLEAGDFKSIETRARSIMERLADTR